MPYKDPAAKRAYMRAYFAKPEIKAKQRKRVQTLRADPVRKAKDREYGKLQRARPEVKAKERERATKRRQDPAHNANVRKNKQRYRAERRALIQNIKLETGCACCGYKRCAAALDFHHVGEKRWSISKAITHSLADLHAEISKCEILCKNCHTEINHAIAQGAQVSG
jgi:hypothetical protein